MIRQYIEQEAKAVQAERENDVSSNKLKATGKHKHPELVLVVNGDCRTC